MPKYNYFNCTDFRGVATLIKGDFENELFPELKAYKITLSEPWDFFGMETYRVNRSLVDVVHDLVSRYGCVSDEPIGTGWIYRLKYLPRR